MIKINKNRQKQRRQRLRNNATPWERKLWRYLQNSKLEGYKFRRQQGIESYIVDFYCAEFKLIIELDGGGHFVAEKMKKDKKKESGLESWGYTILRYTNNEIMENIEGVLFDIRNKCIKLSSNHP